MKSLAKLKDDARRHEQREEWQQAIDLYLRVLRAAEDGETELELPLFNRVGDLYVRLGRQAEAVRYYEQAADRYADVGLFNNAIALCNKVLRYKPDQIEIFRKLGRFSASQGFLTDARHWFLEYARRMFDRGELDSAFAALEDFATITDDPEVRADFARHLAGHGRAEAAIEEFRRAYAGHMRAGKTEAAERLRDEVRTLLPDADLASDVDLTERRGGYGFDDALPGFGESAADELPPIEEDQVEPAPARHAYDDGEASGADEADVPVEAAPLEGFEATAAEADVAIEPPEQLEGLENTRVEVEPVESIEEIEGFDTGRAEEPPPLPLLDEPPSLSGALSAHDDAQADEPAGVGEFDAADEPDRADAFDRTEEPVRAEGFDEADESPDDSVGEGSEATPLPLLDSPAADDRHAADDLYGVGTVDYSTPPEVEPLPAFEPEQPEPEADEAPPEEPTPTGLSSLDGFGSFDRSAQPEEPRGDDYVDLLALINPDEDRVRATRFFVEEKQPTGDEDRDFAEMLAEFKAKVAAHVGEDDSGSHYDLGLAFKEMGLIEEAIGEFQVALRAGANRLKVFEELGQCFILKRQPTIAVKILSRALQLEHEDDLELIGLYYYLGRAYEELGQTSEARDAYERVLGLDISFKDVMERVTRL